MERSHSGHCHISVVDWDGRTKTLSEETCRMYDLLADALCLGSVYKGGKTISSVRSEKTLFTSGWVKV
eukprot:927177-Amphidinium_carterae.1